MDDFHLLVTNRDHILGGRPLGLLWLFTVCRSSASISPAEIFELWKGGMSSLRPFTFSGLRSLRWDSLFAQPTRKRCADPLASRYHQPPFPGHPYRACFFSRAGFAKFHPSRALGGQPNSQACPGADGYFPLRPAGRAPQLPEPAFVKKLRGRNSGESVLFNDPSP